MKKGRKEEKTEKMKKGKEEEKTRKKKEGKKGKRKKKNLSNYSQCFFYFYLKNKIKLVLPEGSFFNSYYTEE